MATGPPARPGDRVLPAWRPPARVWLRLAAEFQPGLADARTETTAKTALAAGVAEMSGDVSKLGPAWGDMGQPLAAWRGVMHGSLSSDWGDKDVGEGVWGVDKVGLPTHLFLYEVGLRRSLSAQVCRLVSLTHLCLRCNQLATLPGNFNCLTSLTYLDLGENELTTLPESVCSLSNLMHLALDCNRIISLSASVGRLVGLKTLLLFNNRLETMPDSIIHLTSLARLDLTFNRFKYKEKRRIRTIRDRCFPNCFLPFGE